MMFTDAKTIAHLLAAISLAVYVPVGWEVLGWSHRGHGIAAVRWGGAATLVLPASRLTAVAAVPWLVVTTAFTLLELRTWWRGVKNVPTLARLFAAGWLAMAAAWLVLDRGLWTVLGFSHATVAFTVAHFLNAGFGLSVLAAVVTSQVGPRLAQALAVLALGGPVAVAGGFIVAGEGGVVPTIAVTAGVLLISLTTLGALLPHVIDRRARLLLVVSSGAWLVSMPLALVWALVAASWTSAPTPTPLMMAAVHGTVNELGFVGCGLLGWRLVRRGAGRRSTDAHLATA
jgi:hypothetical protein